MMRTLGRLIGSEALELGGAGELWHLREAVQLWLASNEVRREWRLANEKHLQSMVRSVCEERQNRRPRIALTMCVDNRNMFAERAGCEKCFVRCSRDSKQLRRCQLSLIDPTPQHLRVLVVLES